MEFINQAEGNYETAFYLVMDHYNVSNEESIKLFETEGENYEVLFWIIVEKYNQTIEDTQNK